MISNASFRRKVIYGSMVAVLLFPLYLISRPSVREGQRLTEGGVLAQLRAEHDLSQADLGQIDPASETMKLATLGMRGIAANLLWERATRYHRRHDWDNLTATLNQISRLQPNFISVWQFQGWNLAYNVSVEFDDYRSRYHWVKRGINFLRDGVRYNSREPVLPWEIGWTFGHKIGRADEYVQFRRLFSDDTDFHDELSASINMDNTLGPRGDSDREKPDNWLTGREWFLRGQDLVDSGVPIRGRLVDDTGRIRRGKSPLIFHSHPPKWLMNHAIVIEEEGVLDEKAQYAWMRAGEQWVEYGKRQIPTSYGPEIRLEDQQALEDRLEKIGQQIDEMLPHVRKEIKAEKMATLDAEERSVLEIPPKERTFSERQLALAAERKTRVSFPEMAARAPEKLKPKVEKLVIEGQFAREVADAIFNYRQQVNYDYWKLRCEIEQSDTAIKARRLVYEAGLADKRFDLETMKEKYEAAWEEWAKIFAEHPIMMEDTTAEELMDSVRRYAWLMNQMDEPFPPDDFPLKRLLEMHGLEEEY